MLQDSREEFIGKQVLTNRTSRNKECWSNFDRNPTKRVDLVKCGPRNVTCSGHDISAEFGVKQQSLAHSLHYGCI